MNPLTLLKKIAHKIKSLITGESLSDYRLNNNQSQSNKKKGSRGTRNRWGFPRIPR
jgi:hypothetical protein